MKPQLTLDFGHWHWTNKMFADLHLHTNFSDGTYTPEELVAQAARNKLAAIALTDHDTVEAASAPEPRARRWVSNSFRARN